MERMLWTNHLLDQSRQISGGWEELLGDFFVMLREVKRIA